MKIKFFSNVQSACSRVQAQGTNPREVIGFLVIPLHFELFILVPLLLLSWQGEF